MGLITGRMVSGWCVAAAMLVGACGDDDTRETTFGGGSNTVGTTGGGTTSGTSTSGSSTDATTGTTVEPTTMAPTGGGESSSGTTGAAPVCGDGKVDPDEACDLGAENSDEGLCKTDCTAQVCGDGFVGPGEGCDDGNQEDADECTNTCKSPACGDGVVQLGEACDDGNMEDADACTNACTAPACGDAIVQLGEACDDGNMEDLDACSNACEAAACGDGVVQMGEACDDGNMENADACSNACKAAACGDSIVQMGEACDDGNVIATDACTDTCAAAKCGDKIVYAGKETCDDGAQTALCDADCTAPACGDGVLNALVAEECDDANLVNNDGCSATCKVELACKAGGVLQSSSPDKKMIVCYNNQLCEQDFGTMCPSGWTLCSAAQFNNRNTAWNYNPAKTVFGAIRCRGGGGAGHVGISGLLSNDVGDNCTYGSSKPQCVANYGCNEKDYYAACCAPTPTCGDGKVDAPEEECDDGNKSDDDLCFSNCMTKTKPGC